MENTRTIDSKLKLLGCSGNFIWTHGKDWLIEISVITLVPLSAIPDDPVETVETIERFTWSDPDYGGNNTIRPFNGTTQEWLDEFSSGDPSLARDKGHRSVYVMCGEKFQFIAK